MNKVYTLKNILPVFVFIAVIIGLTACDNPANSQQQTQTVATPTASPAAGPYLGTQTITLVSATSGAAIYYTINGTTPTTASTLYTTAIPINTTTTLKAIAVKAGMTDSEVLTAVYTIAPPESEDYFGTWKAANNSTVTISANKLTCHYYYGSRYTLENITWAVYENPNTAMTTDYPTGYAIKGTVTDSNVEDLIVNGTEYTDYWYIKTDKTSLAIGGRPWMPQPTYSSSSEIYTKEEE